MTRFDRLLVVLLIVEIILATGDSVLAKDPPPSCDNKCRERRYITFYDAKEKATYCVMWQYRWCIECRCSYCLCSPNEKDIYVDEGCFQTNRQQALCTVMTCSPLCGALNTSGPGNDKHEAAEGATDYISIDSWYTYENLFVFKCTVEATGKTYTWPDEQ